MAHRIVRRFDVGEISASVEVTPQGFLKIPGFVTRVGVFPYIEANGQTTWELRHPDDVFDPESLKTLKNAPVTLEHPPVMVTPDNFEEYAVGYTTDQVDVNRDLVESCLIVADKDAIEKISNREKRELSAGYLAETVDEAGEYNGIRYNKRQKNIRYNHVAVVERGRAGPEVRLRMDSGDAQQLKTSSVVISGETVELPAHLAAVVQSLLDRYDEMRAKLGQLEEKMSIEEGKKDVGVSQKGISAGVHEEQMAPDGRAAGAKKDEEGQEPKKDNEDLIAEIAELKQALEASKAKQDEMQAKLDEKSSQSEGKEQQPAGGLKMDSITKAVKARRSLERSAERVLPAELQEKFDAMSDVELMKAVVKHRHPKAELEGKSEVYIQTRFDSIVESLEESTLARREMGSQLMSKMDSSGNDPKAARARMIADAQSAWAKK